MKHRKIVSLTIGVLMTITSCVQAQVTILSDDFESGTLSQWTGQNGGSTSGLITADPLNPTNHVLTFTAVTFGGDIFGVPPHTVNGSVQRIVLSFDFLGIPSSAPPGGFAGIATSNANGAFFLAGTDPTALDAPPPVATQLVADGQWHHYEIDFSALAAANNFTNIQVTLEDFGAGGSVPGDIFFDNVNLTATLIPGLIDQLVPCAGPTLDQTWKNHGQYVSAVSNLTAVLLNDGLITIADQDEFLSDASRSDCGKKPKK
jgi:hypothetical protein